MTIGIKRLFIISLVLVLSFSFLSCAHEPEETKYDVWTDYCSASDFASFFGYTLNEGCYSHFPLTNIQFSSITTGSNPNHTWTEADIKNWLIGQGFDNSTASSEIAWLTSNDHCMIATRNMGVVYFLIK